MHVDGAVFRTRRRPNNKWGKSIGMVLVDRGDKNACVFDHGKALAKGRVARMTLSSHNGGICKQKYEWLKEPGPRAGWFVNYYERYISFAYVLAYIPLEGALTHLKLFCLHINDPSVVVEILGILYMLNLRTTITSLLWRKTQTARSEQPHLFSRWRTGNMPLVPPCISLIQQ